jgi:hypothetical protein
MVKKCWFFAFFEKKLERVWENVFLERFKNEVFLLKLSRLRRDFL